MNYFLTQCEFEELKTKGYYLAKDVGAVFVWHNYTIIKEVDKNLFNAFLEAKLSLNMDRLKFLMHCVVDNTKANLQTAKNFTEISNA